MAQSLKLLSSPPSGIGNSAGPFPVSLLVARDELKQTVLKQAIGMAKQLVQESAALEIISGPLQAAEDLERHVQECHTGRDEAIRKDSIRRLRDSLDALI